MSAYFVTGTGTSVGKTYVTCGIVRAIRAAGHKVMALKPIVSGYEPGQAVESDPGLLLDAMALPITPANIAAIAPWRFTAPLSPDVAAAREGRSINVKTLTAFCKSAIDAAPEHIFIEGAGGVSVPLDTHWTNADFIAALGLPVVLVAGTYLGTISHTISAAEALVQRGVMIAAVALSESPFAPMPPAETKQVLGRFMPSVAIHIIARGGDGVIGLAKFLMEEK
jgi:dethiobiotin synthetase